MTKTKINKFQFSFFIKAVSLLSILGIIFGSTLYYFKTLNSSAASINYAGGQISLDKKYLSNGQEVGNISTVSGAEITVRIKYNNTGNLSATGVQITDSLPMGFTYKSGSLKNCYIDLGCQTLSDGLFSLGNLAAGPTAGFLGVANTATTSFLDLGRFQYLKTAGFQTLNLDSCDIWVTNNVASTANCLPTNSAKKQVLSTGNTNVPTSFDLPSGTVNTQSLSGYRYIKAGALANLDLDTCDIWTTNNASEIYNANGGTSCAASGGVATFVDTGNNTNTTQNDLPRSTVNTIDIVGNRYIRTGVYQDFALDTCDIWATNLPLELNNNSNPLCQLPGFATAPVISLDTNVTTGTQVKVIELPRNVGNMATIDTLDSTRGYGYLEYTMLVPATSVGLYGTNAAITGNFGTLSTSSTTTIDSISCSYRFPTGWLRTNITLSDAELRTDQDFTCNFHPRICPKVFVDVNGDGIKNGSDSFVANQTIFLYREDGTTLVFTLQTDAAGLLCFPDVAGLGTVYKVTSANPLTTFNTTGGNTKSVTTASADSINDVLFGYSNGSLTLSVPPAVTFPSKNTTSITQTTCTNISPIQVTDTRFANSGWSLTAVVDNFQVPSDYTKTLAVGNHFTGTPGSLSVTSGDTGPQPGSAHTVSNPFDPFTVATGPIGNAKGIYTIPEGICQVLDPFTVNGAYQTTITFTLI
jgi:uncharacterized repeat protein (TIGR01451 family)